MDVPHKYTGKELDPETGFYFYEARYYDPQLGRFLTPDSIVPNWTDPQDFNRYTYAANNPLKYTDPTGHKPFWKKVKKFFKKAFGFITAAIGFFIPPLAPAMWALNIGMGIYQGISSGAGIGSILGGLAGSMIGGAVFGSLGQGLADGLVTALGTAQSVFSLAGGALIGAAEFGLSGFGASFGGALGAGASFRDALKAGGKGAAVGAITGAVIQGTYNAGWQDVAHGRTIEHQAGLLLGAHGMDPSKFNQLARTLELRRANPRSIYLHGTDAAGAVGIQSSRKLWDDSWVTSPTAYDQVTGKIAIKLSPADYQRFTSIAPPKGEWFALVVAPKSSVVDRGFAIGGAPQWQIRGENKVPIVWKNLNES